MEKNTLKNEKIIVGSNVEWDLARDAIAELNRLLANEISFLESNEAIRNAYSPITWSKLCRYIKHATEGMTAVRLATEGKSNKEIKEETGIRSRRTGAFKAWNSIYRKKIIQVLQIKWRKQEEKKEDIKFLRSIGISISDSDEING